MLDNDRTVWKVDAGKSPYIRVTKMRKFPKNAVEEKRMLSADKEVESCCNLPYNGADAFVCVIPIVNLLSPSICLQKWEQNKE